MRLPRFLIPLVGIAGFGLACGGTGPGASYLGTYTLKSVDGTSLPAAVILSYTNGSKDTTVIRTGSVRLTPDSGFFFTDTWSYYGFGTSTGGATFCSGDYNVDSDANVDSFGTIYCSDQTQINSVYGTWSGNQLNLSLDIVGLGIIDATFQR